MQAAWRWHQWQRIQIILRWSRASGWGQKNMIFVLIKIYFYSKLSFICFMYQVSIHDKEDQTAVRECICWEFSTNFYISIFFLFTFIPSYEIVRPKYIYLFADYIWYCREKHDWKQATALKLENCVVSPFFTLFAPSNRIWKQITSINLLNLFCCDKIHVWISQGLLRFL